MPPIGPSEFQKLQTLVAGTGKVYGTLRMGSPRQITLTSGSATYSIPLAYLRYTELTAYVPSTPDGRNLLLSPIIEQLVINNLLRIYSEGDLPDTPSVPPEIEDRRVHASAVRFSNSDSGLDADTVQEAIDEMVEEEKKGIATCVDGMAIVNLGSSPYSPFPTGSIISVIVTPIGADSNVAAWIENVTISGFSIMASDDTYDGQMSWVASRVG